MIDGYTLFLNKFGKIYPEIYIKIVEFPDEIIIGWINTFKDDKKMMTLERHDLVKDYFDEVLAIHKNHKLFRI